MKLHFNLPLTLFILITNAVCLGSGYDSDEAGFIGCTRQELCGETGSYFATYSKEGLCKTCEFKEHPDRYNACLFCRAPRPSTSGRIPSCSSCILRAQSFVVEKIKKGDEDLSDLVDAVDLELDSRIRKHRWYQPIAAFIDDKAIKDTFPRIGDQPYIYRGALPTRSGKRLHVWVGDIDTDETDRRLIGDDKESKKHVRKFCNRYDIVGPETGAILSAMPAHVVATYEERIKE